MALLAMNDQNPRQHLSNLLKKNIAKAQSPRKISQMISQARPLFLTHPKRILFEQERGTSAQLEELFKFHLPIYHAPRLGEVWALLKNAKGDLTLVTDERYRVHQTCQKEQRGLKDKK